MASGFYDLLAWLLGWKSKAAIESAAAGPYRVEIGTVWHTGASAGEPFILGAAVGQTFNTGQMAGQIDGRCG